LREKDTRTGGAVERERHQSFSERELKKQKFCGNEKERNESKWKRDE